MPQGYFAALTKLPDMYRHCQTTEDPDMNVIDFVTEHLLNLEEGAADENDIDEHELPHNQQNMFFIYEVAAVCAYKTCMAKQGFIIV